MKITKATIEEILRRESDRFYPSMEDLPLYYPVFKRETIEKMQRDGDLPLNLNIVYVDRISDRI